MSSAIMRECRATVSRVAPPICGVRITLSSVSSGLDFGSGWPGNTSSAAPAMLPLRSRSTSASWSSASPAPVLIRYAPGFIRPSPAASMRR